MRGMIVLLGSWLLALAGLLAQTNSAAPHACAASLAQCPEQGCGGDAQLSRLQNRTDPASDPDEWTVADLLALEAKSPRTWQPGTDRAPLQSIGEGTRLVLSGFLQEVASEEPQAANCFLISSDARSIRLRLGSAKNTAAAQSVVAEITPRVRKTKPNWQVAKLSALALQNSYIRVHGWLLWNSALAGHTSTDRASLWEVDPVTEVEVCTASQAACDDGDGWVTLGEYQAH